MKEKLQQLIEEWDWYANLHEEMSGRETLCKELQAQHYGIANGIRLAISELKDLLNEQASD